MSQVTFSSGDQISIARTRDVLDTFSLETLPLTSERDDLERHVVVTRSVHNSRGERVALEARTHWWHNGLSYQLAIAVGGATCGDSEDTCRAEAHEHADNLDKTNRNLPGNLFPTAFYLGDLNGDRRLDLLAVMEDGSAIVFYQNR